MKAALNRLIPLVRTGLILAAMLAFAPPVNAGDRSLVSQVGGGNPHPHIDNSDFAALREYARDIGLDAASASQPAPAATAHRRFDVADIAAMDGPPGPSQASNPHAAMATNPHSGMSAHDDDPDLKALRQYAREVGIETAVVPARKSPHSLRFDVADIAAMDGQPGKLKGEVPTAQAHSDIAARQIDPELNALREYAGKISADQAGPDKASSQYAAADNALDAFRDMLRRNAQPAPSPHPAPDAAPRRRVAPPPAVRGDPGFVNAHRMGSQTCLYCHSAQAESFSRTLMGRIAKTQPAKLDCENCHGPGSAHVQAVGCASCHGEGGVTRRPGIPSLVGQDPQYLVPAMKAYLSGQRKHDLMRLVLTGLPEAEIHNIASYYARQIPDRAQTPPIGDPAAGRAATGLCANCHGDRGISVAPMWPSLAGQDAQYLADAIHGYKAGSRSKVIACAGCHGEGGVSSKPGTPNLAGLEPEYLVPAMKAYASGDRKHTLMRVLVSGVDDGQLNGIAQFYARQSPARARTPVEGNAAAGRNAVALCIGCHGEAGGSVSSAFPSLAGQDARYLAAAIKAYRDDSRAKTVACAGCHGDRGISRTAGMPSLAGLAPQYLVAAMKDYAGGKRKHQVMQPLLADVSETELNTIAQYYAGQVPARADTPTVGNAAAGKPLAASCAGCHGAEGVSANSMWPSLAGQDARYLADAMRGYKDGSRDNPIMKGLAASLDEQAINNIAAFFATLAPAQPGRVVAAPVPAQPAAAPAAQPSSRAATQTPPSTAATIVARCSGCHGQNGVTATPGMPSLAGLAPQYLVGALKAYASGQRKNDLMKSMLTGISEADFSAIAQYYAGQAPARAATAAVGDAAAGRAPSASCGGCHGPQGISENPIWPSLAGQDAKYLADAVRGYRDGTRDHPLMKSLVASLNDQTINNIASHYATLAPARPAPAAPAQPAPSAAQIPATNPAPAEARCALCHGEKGVSKTPGIPSLAGLSRQYLLASLKAYSSGERTHQVMRSILVGVDEAEFGEIALYYSAQTPARAATPAVGDAAAGRALAAACGGCHGAQGISDNPIWPSLAGQDARYIADSLRAYRDGTRNNAMMKGFATQLSNEAINNIASYYASVSPIPAAPPQPAAPVASPAPPSAPPPVASPAPAQPSRPAAPALAGHGAPALVRNNLLAGLDDRTVADIAAYFASLTPTRMKPGGGREPAVVRNNLVASLDEGAVRNVASYYGSLVPEQPASARNAPPRPEPASVRFVRPEDGSGPGGIVTFRKNDLSRKSDQHNAICLGCHEKGDRTYWNASTHETRGVACTECHTVMRPVSRKAALKTPVEMETCFQCHKDRRAQVFRSSHMPLREGKMTCSNCHNPHGSATEGMLKEASINDTCYKCHAEKRGPFLFEHAPVRQNCLSCHDPHGTSNDNLLKVSRPRLCAECHGFGHGSLANGPRTVETFGRSCQNCHTQIHGSNSPSGALLQR